MAGKLEKMAVALDSPVRYALRVGDEEIPLNPLLGKEFTLAFTGEIRCMSCDRRTNKSFGQGYCFPCFRTLARCDMCVVRPEQCHYAAGTCREPEWGDAHCNIPHFVYLANSSGAKVGITRHTQLPTRWIDQGAVQALPIFEVKSRYHSGLVEVAFKEHVADKTDWRKMLKGDVEAIDLPALRDELVAAAAPALEALSQRLGGDALRPLPGADVVSIAYPVLEHPQKVKSMSFDKTPRVGGTLMGIKGQYLLFDAGVINLRNFRGYEVELEA